jgi:hypothetical protein
MPEERAGVVIVPETCNKPVKKCELCSGSVTITVLSRYKWKLLLENYILMEPERSVSV